MTGYYSRPARLARQMRQLLFPRRCPCCRRVLGTLPFCEVCTPRLEELRRGPVMRLDASRHYLGALDGAAAPYRYEGVVRSAILRAKYEGESWTAVELGVEMTARLFGAEVEMHFAEPVPGLVSGAAIGYDCIVPVPATSRRRGYNVPERMAQSFGSSASSFPKKRQVSISPLSLPKHRKSMEFNALKTETAPDEKYSALPQA